MSRALSYLDVLRLLGCLGCVSLAAACTEPRDYRDRGDRSDREYGERRDRDRESRPRGRIDIESARYGVDGSFCNPEDVLQRTANRARRQGGRFDGFTIAVNNDLCGDPAPRRAKRLFVSFHCGDGPTLRAQAGEGESLTLDCAR